MMKLKPLQLFAEWENGKYQYRVLLCMGALIFNYKKRDSGIWDSPQISIAGADIMHNTAALIDRKGKKKALWYLATWSVALQDSIVNK